MKKLRIGTGGIPLTSADKSIESGVKRLTEIGLNHLEIEFVYNVYLDAEKATELAEKLLPYDITLSIHAPYYINLASADNKVYYSSINRITKSLAIGEILKAKSVTFHSAFFQKESHDEVSKRVIKGVNQIKDDLKNLEPTGEKQIRIAPELTGKPTQFGSLQELINLSKETGCSLCIDFAHFFARTNGEYNSYDKFMETFEVLEKNLGAESIHNLHMHLSGIIHSEKGERHHVSLLKSVEEYEDYGVKVEGIEKHFDKLINAKKNGGSPFNWQDVLKAIKASNVKGYLVCESPILELDALLMKSFYDSL